MMTIKDLKLQKETKRKLLIILRGKSKVLQILFQIQKNAPYEKAIDLFFNNNSIGLKYASMASIQLGALGGTGGRCIILEE